MGLAAKPSPSFPWQSPRTLREQTSLPSLPCLTYPCSPLPVYFPVSLDHNVVPAHRAILCPAAPGVKVEPLPTPLAKAIAIN